MPQAHLVWLVPQGLKVCKDHRAFKVQLGQLALPVLLGQRDLPEQASLEQLEQLVLVEQRDLPERV